jgi:hypothetical protein
VTKLAKPGQELRKSTRAHYAKIRRISCVPHSATLCHPLPLALSRLPPRKDSDHPPVAVSLSSYSVRKEERRKITGYCDSTKPLPTEIKDTLWKGAQKLLECKLGLKGSAKFCQKKKF